MLIAEISVLILVVIWLGYPAVVAALARLRRPVASQWPREDALPSLSVILATREDAAAIARRVENLARVEYPADRVEILVCVDAGTAGGATGPGPEPIENALQRLSNGRTVRIVSGPAPGGKAVTLNAGVAAATGSVLIFADTAQWFEADAFLRLVDRLADPRVAAVSGRLLMADEEVPATLAEWY